MHLFDKIIIINLSKFNGRAKAHFEKWDYKVNVLIDFLLRPVCIVIDLKKPVGFRQNVDPGVDICG